MKCRNPNDKHRCPLFNKEIYLGMCIEVQEVREDNMDMQLFPEPFDICKANEKCEQCSWFKVNNI